MTTLRARLLALVAAVILLTGAGAWLLLSRFTHLEADRFILAEAREQAARFAAPLAAHHRARGGWAGVDSTLDRIAGATGRTAVLLLPDGGVRLPASLGARDVRSRVLADGVHEVGWERTRDGRVELTAFRLRGGVELSEDGRAIGRLHLLPAPPVLREARDGPAPVRFVHGVRRSAAIAVGLAVVVALVVAAALAGAAVRPLEDLTRAVRRLAAGDLEARAGIRTKDEIGALGAAFDHMAERIARTERERRALVADVAHELRTPLTNLQGQLEAMQDGLVPAEGAALESLHEEIVHLTRLVDDLEQLAAADAGRLRVEPVPLVLRAPIEQAVAALAPRAGRAGVRVTVEGDADLVARADARRLGQVLRNLLANAIAHTPPDGRVAVRVTARADDGEAIAIAGEDDGEGIAAEHLERIFERFYRVDPSRTRETGGSGLGLAVVRQLVLLMGGTVRAESAPGAGTTVTFTLPRAEAPAGTTSS